MFLFNFTVLLSMLTILTAASIEPENVSVQLVTSADMKNLLQEYPDAQPFTVQILPKEISERSAGLDTANFRKVYAVGARATGDSMVYSDKKDASWPIPRNVRFTATYPTSGAGANLTNIIMTTDQSTPQGVGYFVAGGVGYRYVTFVIDTPQTYWFNYDLKMFGTP